MPDANLLGSGFVRRTPRDDDPGFLPTGLSIGPRPFRVQRNPGFSTGGRCVTAASHPFRLGETAPFQRLEGRDRLFPESDVKRGYDAGSVFDIAIPRRDLDSLDSLDCFFRVQLPDPNCTSLHCAIRVLFFFQEKQWIYCVNCTPLHHFFACSSPPFLALSPKRPEDRIAEESRVPKRMRPLFQTAILSISRVLPSQAAVRMRAGASTTSLRNGVRSSAWRMTT